MRISGIFISLAALAITFYAGRVTKVCPAPAESVDTVYVRDTIRDTIPVETVRYVTRIDSVAYTVTVDSTRVDTVFVHVPIERTQYKTDAYDLWIEGYRAKLIEINVFRETFYVDRVKRYKTKPKWGLGVHAGYGFSINGRPTPYIGVGIHYNILTW